MKSFFDYLCTLVFKLLFNNCGDNTHNSALIIQKMKTKVSYLDPKRVLIQTQKGDKFIIGFHSEINYLLEQTEVPFTDFLASLFDKIYKGDESVIMGEINRQLIIHRFGSVFFFHRDYIQNRIIIGERIRELRESKNMDLATLALKAGIQPNTLKRIEAGKLSPDLDVLCHIAQGMEMRLDFVELKNDKHECTSNIRLG